jgi:hypothetical protein
VRRLFVACLRWARLDSNQRPTDDECVPGCIRVHHAATEILVSGEKGETAHCGSAPEGIVLLSDARRVSAKGGLVTVGELSWRKRRAGFMQMYVQMSAKRKRQCAIAVL